MNAVQIFVFDYLHRLNPNSQLSIVHILNLSIYSTDSSFSRWLRVLVLGVTDQQVEGALDLIQQTFLLSSEIFSIMNTH